MPQRLLRPQIRQSERWNRLSYFEQSFYIRLLTLVDDYGRYEAHPVLLSHEAFPFGGPDGKPVTPEAITNALQTFANNCCQMLSLYQSDGKDYLQLTRWVERPRSESKYPDMIPANVITVPTIANKCPQMLTSPPSPSPSPKPKPCPSDDVGFEEFWEAYPKKKGKADAKKAWSKIKDTKSLIPKMLEVIRRDSKTEEWTKEGGKFIPHPASWLRAGRWDDEPTLINVPVVHPHWPPRREVELYAKEKGDTNGYWVSWFRYWEQRDFKRNGTLIDWKVEFSKQFSEKRP